MNPVQDFLDKYAGVSTTAQQKQADVTLDSYRIKTQMPQPPEPDYYGLAVGNATGKGLRSSEGIERDIRTMNPLQLRMKYGEEADKFQRGMIGGRQEYREDVTVKRSKADAIEDNIGSAIAGYGNTLGGLTALGVGLVDPESGLKVSQFMNDLNEGMRSNQSDELNSLRKVNAVEQQLSQRDNKLQYDIDKSTDGEFKASLKRVGRDLVDTFGSQNNDLVQDTVASGVGSLFGGTAIGSTLKSIGAAVLSRAGTGALATGAAKVGNAVRMPAAIAGMEAGGAYQQTVTEAYELLRDRTDLTEEEKIQKATQAGMMAAAIQAPISAATGTLVSRFESSPLRAPASSLVSNMLRETLEEGIQSTTGQLASNLGVQKYVDPERELAQGVGEQTALGAIGGLGSVGVVQVPALAGTALRGTLEATKLAGRTTIRGARYGAELAGAAKESIGAIVKPIADILIARGDKIIAENEKASPISDDKIQSAFEAAIIDAPVATETLKQSIENTNATPEEKQEANQYVDDMMQGLTFDMSEYEGEEVPEIVRNSLDGVTNRLEAIQNLANLVNQTADDSVENLTAGAYLFDMMNTYQDLLNKDPAAFGKLPKNDPANQIISDYETVSGRIQDTPKIARALRKINQMMAQAQEQGNIPVVEDTQVNTPEGQQTIKNTIAVAEIAPNKANPEANDKILYHEANGTITLNPVQKAALQASSALVRAQQAYDKQAEAVGLRPEEFVTKQVISDMQDDRREKSAAAHLAGVVASYRSGNLELASARLADFLKFAKHMSNKVAALNTALATGKMNAKDGVRYEALTPKRTWVKSLTGLWINPYAPGSVRQAQRIAYEAEAVGNIANSLVDIFPDLNGSHLAPVSLDPSLIGNADEIVKAYRSGQNKDRTETTEVPEPSTQEVLDDLDNEINESNVDQVPEEAKPEVVPEVQEEAVPEVEPEPEAIPEPVTEEVIEPVEETQSEEITEPVVEATVEPINEPVRKGMDAVYPSLFGSNTEGVVSLFKKAFRLPAVAKSRTVGTGEPVNFIRQLLASSATLSSIDEGLAKGFSPDISKAYTSILKVSDTIITEMNKSLDSFTAKRSKDLFNGKLNRYSNGKALNITDVNGEVVSYNQELLETAVLAGIQWMITGEQQSATLDAEDVAGILGLEEHELEDGIVDRFNQGMTLVEAKRSLAQKISSYWGMSPNPTASLAMIEGIPEAVASEMILALEASGQLKVDRFESNGKTINIYIPEKLSEDNPIHKIPDLIEQIVLVEPEEINYIGEVPTKVATTQLRNSITELTQEQQEVLAKEQAVPHYVNTNMVNFLTSLGLDNVLKIFGVGDLEGRTLNQNHKNSLEGQNLTVRSAYLSLQNLITEATHKAEVDGVELDQVPIHYRYNFTRVNRMQMLGKNNPQASKLMREAVLPTRSTMDLTDPDSLNAFYLSLAQALGVKVHNKLLADSVEDVTNRLNGNLAPLVQTMQNWLEANRELTADEVQAFADADLSNVGLHAVMEYARYLNQTDNSSFTTSLYVEADGVTNGPINTMVLMTPGEFTQAWMKNVAKGGLFFGKPNKTMNEHRVAEPTDLYQATTDQLKLTFDRLRTKISGDSNITNQMNALINLMDMFIPDLSIENGELILDRGIAKNPLTITIYGSGARGIAGNVTDTLIASIYEKMSEVAQYQADNENVDVALAMFGGPKEQADIKLARFQNAMDALTGQIVVTRKGQLVIQEAARNKRTFNPQTFTFSKDEFNNIQQNMLSLFVNPLREAIAATVGSELIGDGSSTEALRKSLQVQSIFAQFAFQREVSRMLEEKAKDPNWIKDDFLSQKEMASIYDKLKHIMPFINTGTQNFFVSGSQNVEISDRSFGSALNDQLRTPAQFQTPSDAGVAGIPFMVIGMGDGQMMQILSKMKELTRTLKIFDGVHLPLDQLEEGSRMANQAVWESWMSNPLQMVSESFTEFMKDVTFKDANKEQLAALTKALFPPTEWNSDLSASQIFKEMKFLEQTIRTMALDVEARHNVMNRVNVSVDQMASVGAAYQHEGDIDLTDLNDIQIEQALNKALNEERIKLFNIPVSENISEEIQKVGRATKSGARILSFTAVRNLYKLMNIPADQQAVLGDILRSLGTKDYKIVFGTPDQVAAYAEQYGKDIPTPKIKPDGTIEGFTVFNDKTIYLYNPSSETLIHELIHAATFENVNDHYEGNGDTAVAGAIERLEPLMEQFLSLGSELTEVGPALRTAYANARVVILDYLNNGKPAEAMNEFMAWGLTNTDLVRLEKRTEANVLSRIAATVIDALKTLIFGRKKVTKPGNDIFSNLRFNTNIILRAQPSVTEMVKDTTLFQNSTYGNSERLIEIQKAFDQKIVDYLNVDLGEQITRDAKVVDAIQTGVRITKSMNAHGFPMTMQELSTFQMVVSALATEASIDPNALVKAQELYAHVVKNLTVDDFIPEGSLDPEQDRYYAQEKYNSIMGNFLTEVDAKNRSTLLPSFLGLAIVNDDFRRVLSNIEVPKTQKLPGENLDNVLENLGNSMMDALSARMSGTAKADNIKAAIDALSKQIVSVAQDRQSFIEQGISGASTGINRANEKLVEMIGNASDQIMEKAEAIKEKTDNKLVSALASYAQFMAGIATEKNGKIVAENILTAMNRMDVWKPFYDLTNDLIGRTESNKNIYDMIKLVRALVSQDRQHFREMLPTVIADKFSRKITNEEWTSMFAGLGKTDLAGLRSGFSNEEILQILQDNDLIDNHINDLETKIQELDPKSWPLIQRKAQQLAKFMNTGIPGSNLLRNAYAVAHLFGEGKRNQEPTNQLITMIDQLVSFYAYESLSEPVKDNLSSLAQSEAEGISFVISYLTGQRVHEAEKTTSPSARINGYKGYIPSDPQSGVTLFVAEDTKNAQLVAMGYERVAHYGGSTIERGAPSRGYYFAPVSGRAMYNQGILQTARSTAFGVDVMSGFTSGSITAGRITDPETVQRIDKLSRKETGSEPLLPIYDRQGRVVAYERSVDPNQLIRTNRDTHLGKMIGVWRGRQVEEIQAHKVNELLIDRLHEMYLTDIKDSASKKAEYVDLFNRRTVKQDPILEDAIKLITPETRAYIENVFGDEFWVRKDMLNDVLGYRAASIGDIWTENSRWDPDTLQRVKRMLVGLMGNKAYVYSLNAESLVQNFVTDAKTTIVIKSVVVPIMNLTANVFQLAGRGVPLPSILRGMPKKAAEIDAYAKSRMKQIQLEAELNAAAGNLVRTRQINAEIQSITDSHKRMSVWPLIQAGEFSSISDAGVSRDEILLTEGRLNEYIEKLTSKLPKSFQTAARYAIVARDTALFQGLQKAVEYGDFLAKAVLYEDLIKRQGKSKEYALGRITEEFVNYDRLPGRFRGAMESNGLLWFWSFKIRSAKIAVSMIRNNPLQSLLVSLVPSSTVFGTIGLPIDDNIFSVAADGRLDYSMGPGQGFRSFTLNPWFNLTH